MPRLTLAAMRGTQVAEHYIRHQQKIITTAQRDVTCAILQDGSHHLIAAAKKRLERVRAIHAPRRAWQLEAAKERQKKYGVTVAAGFMAAYGWSIEAAMWTLLRK